MIDKKIQKKINYEKEKRNQIISRSEFRKSKLQDS